MPTHTEHSLGNGTNGRRQSASDVVSAAASGPAHRYTVELFGGLRLRELTPHGRIIARFRTQKTAALLAYLAFHRDRSHSREVLIERFWPEPGTSGRMSLAVALSSLRSQLEPPGLPAQSVLISDRTLVGINPDAVTTDVAAFEALLDRAESADSPLDTGEQESLLTEAVSLYRPELLPGFYDDWIVPQQERLADRYRAAVRRLARSYEKSGRVEEAIHWARTALQSDLFSEEACAELVRLLLAVGNPDAAVREYHQYRERLGEDAKDSGVGDSIDRLLSSFRPADKIRSNPSAPSSARSGPDSPIIAAAVAAAEAASAANASMAASDTSMAAVVTPAAAALPAAAPEARVGQPCIAPLPAPLTRFFGRDNDLPRLHRLVNDPDNRLVTVTGPGGMGKTRLALAFAQELRSGGTTSPSRNDFGAAGELGAPSDPMTVLWASLAQLSDPTLLPATLAEMLGAERIESAGVSPRAAIVATLRALPRPVLLLDNMEHLLEEGAPLVEHLLVQVPALTCVVTSRVRLGVPGEREFALGALPAPPPATNEQEPDALLQWYPAVALFVDRAQLARPGFQITPRNAPAIAELVRRLEGIPLAIELAAARSQVLTPQQMLAQLFPPGAEEEEVVPPPTGPSQRGFALLVNKTPSRNTPERHRSLKATLAWSYDLLSPELQRFFTALAVFRGTWDAAAVDTVLTEVGWHDPSLFTLDALAQLCDASLVRPVEESPSSSFGDDSEDEMPQVRFMMLETLRSYAEEQQKERFPQAKQAICTAHAKHYLSVAEAAEQRARQTPAAEAHLFDLLDQDRENLRAALRLGWEQSRQEPDGSSQTILRLTCALSRYWQVRGHLTEGRRWFRMALEGHIPALSGKDADIITDLALVAKALNKAGTLAFTQGDAPEAERLLRLSLSLREHVPDPLALGGVLNNLAMLASDREDYAEAGRLYEQALASLRLANVPRFVGRLLSNMSVLFMRQGELTRAEQLCKESLEIAQSLLDRHGEALRISNLGEIYRKQGSTTRAAECFRSALQLAHAAKDPVGMVYAFINLGIVAAMAGDDRRADRLLAAALHECAAQQIRLTAQWLTEIIAIRPALQNTIHLEASPDGSTLPTQKMVDILLARLHPSDHAPVPMSLSEATTYALNHFDTASIDGVSSRSFIR